MSDRRVALYARVSTEQQARDHTIASQLAALRERIAADGGELEPDDAYINEGYSGSLLLRPALERLRDAVAAGEIERVYVLAPDRLARRYAHQVFLIEEFQRAGAELVFLNHPTCGTAEDDLLLQIQGVIAEYERAKILERSRRGRRHAARSGLVNAFTTAPYGYRYIPKDLGDGTVRFEVVPEEARVVRQIFAWVSLERLSLREVYRRLQHAGCVPRRGAGRWYASTVRGMLQNMSYIGAGHLWTCPLCAGTFAAASDPRPPPALSPPQCAGHRTAGGVDRGAGPRSDRPHPVRGRAGAVERKPPPQTGERQGTALAVARADRLPALWVRLLRQDGPAVTVARRRTLTRTMDKG
jgi:site-specific DNA recombinase